MVSKGNASYIIQTWEKGINNTSILKEERGEKKGGGYRSGEEKKKKGNYFVFTYGKNGESRNAISLI